MTKGILEWTWLDFGDLQVDTTWYKLYTELQVGITLSVNTYDMFILRKSWNLSWKYDIILI